MILHPGALALVVASLATAGLLLYAAGHALAILRHWDLSSGSELQLRLERRTYLVSTLVGWVMAFELVSLFLYVFTADALAPLFRGAMCAAGSLRAAPGGYEVLVLKLGGAVLAGLWLLLDHADRQGYDYPLLRPKYGALLAVTPLLLAEAWLQLRFLTALRPQVITSCCGSLFGKSGSGLGSDLAGLDPRTAAAAFLAAAGAALLAALALRRTGRGALPLALASALLLPAGLAAAIAWVSPYVYELPTHHCPFCLLQREYLGIGYPLYGALLGASVAGMGAGLLAPFRRIPSLAQAVPALQRRLAGTAAGMGAALLAIVAWAVLGSNLKG